MDKYKKIRVVGKGAFGAAVLVQARSNPAIQYIIKEVDVSRLGQRPRRRERQPRHAHTVSARSPGPVGTVHNLTGSGQGVRVERASWRRVPNLPPSATASRAHTSGSTAAAGWRVQCCQHLRAGDGLQQEGA